MSNLIYPYEISVWDDVYIDGKLTERRLAVIGNHKMISQGRALEPTLTQNVNGSKKLTFKMYKYYKDNATGEKVTNLLYPLLIAERKVKLKYGKTTNRNGEEIDKWYDFVIKEIQEDSTNYLATYILEDALVVELSRNGFETTLDKELMNNHGNALKLAKEVLKGTDWEVESEVLVQSLEEELFYVQLPKNLNNLALQPMHLIDQKRESLNVGIDDEKATLFSGGETVLAFYSSCTGKPRRFQFIYSKDGYFNKASIDGSYIPARDDSRVIIEPDCQYYIDFDSPDDIYTVNVKGYDLFLPEGFTLITPTGDTNPSSWFKGKRYEFTHQSDYISCLERYCQKYKKGEEDYYGFIDTEYITPVDITNYVTNSTFENSYGWLLKGGSASGTVDSAYCRLDNGVYHTLTSDYSDGYGDQFFGQYSSCLHLTFEDEALPVVLNSGIFDNRKVIEQMPLGEEWVLDVSATDKNGTLLEVSASIQEYSLQIEGHYAEKEDSNFAMRVTAHGTADNVQRYYCTVEKTLSEKEFKRARPYICLQFNYKPETSDNSPQALTEVYLTKCSFYRKVLNKKDELLTPENYTSSDLVTTNHLYKYFPADQVVDSKGDPKQGVSEEDLTYTVRNTLRYGEFKPVYNSGAEKIASINVTESNYFNNLQTIAETFEAWLSLETERDDTGGITKKIAKFKNYVGDDNHAFFRYGINLKNIQRNNSSKNITSKLIVLPNSNELAPNKSCMIQPANANQTGEGSIYDFSYYQDIGVMDLSEYLDTCYSLDGAQGLDSVLWKEGQITNSNDFNVQGCFNRLKAINSQIHDLGEEEGTLAVAISDLEGSLEVHKKNQQNAEDERERIRDEVQEITGTTIQNLLIGTDVEADEFQAQARNFLDIDEDGSNDIKLKSEELKSGDVIHYVVTAEVLNKKFLKRSFLAPSLKDSEWNMEPLVIGKGDDFVVHGQAYTQATKTLQSPMEYRYKLSENVSQAAAVIDFIFYNPFGDDVSQLKIETNKEFKKLFINGNKIETSPEKGETSVTYILNYEECLPATIEGLYVDNRQCTIVAYLDTSFAGSEESIKITPTYYKAVGNIQIQFLNKFSYLEERLAEAAEFSDYLVPFEFIVKRSDIKTSGIYYITIPKGETTGSTTIVLEKTEKEGLIKYLKAYEEASAAYNQALIGINNVEKDLKSYQQDLENLRAKISQYEEWRNTLNRLFYSRYSRFIREGTWTDENYMDPNLYYADAKSVLYDSRYPSTEYTINVVSLKGLSGYELFDFRLGDKTHVVDPEFFGSEKQIEVIITEMVEVLDNQSKNTIKVQNYKNQFKDLFQQITATVQQAQYKSGAWETAAKFAQTTNERKTSFVSEALQSATKDIEFGSEAEATAITLKGSDNRILRINGNAIALGQTSDDGGTKWTNAITHQGINATALTAGAIDTNRIQIMNGNNASFLWNEYGLSAFWNHTDATGAVSGVLGEKFVRFDKYGLYGIDGALNADITINGKEWYPGKFNSTLTPDEEIEEYSTFALTWQGLKVSSKTPGGNSSIVKIGKHVLPSEEIRLISVFSKEEEVFSINENGNVSIKGQLQIRRATLEDRDPGLLAEYSSEPWYLKPDDPDQRVGTTLALNKERLVSDASYTFSFVGYFTKTKTFKVNLHCTKQGGYYEDISLGEIEVLPNKNSSQICSLKFTIPAELKIGNYQGLWLQYYVTRTEDIGLDSGKTVEWCAFESIGLTDGTFSPCMPLSGFGEGFSWDMDPEKGFFMKNQIDDNTWENVFAIYRGDNGQYQAHLNGEITATKGNFGILSYDGNPEGTLTFIDKTSQKVSQSSFGLHGLTISEWTDTVGGSTRILQLTDLGIEYSCTRQVGSSEYRNSRIQINKNGLVYYTPQTIPGSQNPSKYACAFHLGPQGISVWCPELSNSDVLPIKGSDELGLDIEVVRTSRYVSGVALEDYIKDIKISLKAFDPNLVNFTSYSFTLLDIYNAVKYYKKLNEST